jgi:hypothetical protein
MFSYQSVEFDRLDDALDLYEDDNFAQETLTNPPGLI